MKRLPVLALAALLSACVSPYVPPETDAFRIYRGDGSPAELRELLREMRAADVTFLGENHDDPVAHALELRLLQESAEPGLALSLEMFETDVQIVLDEYLAGFIDAGRLEVDARAWSNYTEAYAPLVDFAKAEALPVLAANAPRRYVSLVGREGAAALERLSAEARAYLPPLPYPPASPAYREKFMTLMTQTLPSGSHAGEEVEGEDEEGENSSAVEQRLARSLEAQSLWDAGMAWSIAEWLRGHPEGRVLHVNGSFHTEGRLGLVEQLAGYLPEAQALVVTLRPSAGFPAFDPDSMRGLGDFVVVTPAGD